MSGLFQSVVVELGICQIKSTAYHSQSQGALERFHQTLKTMMRAYCMTQKHNWDEGIYSLFIVCSQGINSGVLGILP